MYRSRSRQFMPLSGRLSLTVLFFPIVSDFFLFLLFCPKSANTIKYNNTHKNFVCLCPNGDSLGLLGFKPTILKCNK